MEPGMSGLRADQLAGLLKVGTDDDVSWLIEDQQPVGDLLRAKLGEPIPLDASKPDSVPAVLERPCEAMRAYPSLAGLLADPEADVVALRTLKDYAKTLARLSRCAAAESVTTTLYYAAIAAALVHGGVRITQHDYGSLGTYFTRLLKQPWFPDALKGLFRKAGDVCQQCAGKEGPEAGL